jgi:hypothetical protein
MELGGVFELLYLDVFVSCDEVEGRYCKTHFFEMFDYFRIVQYVK